MAVRPWTASVEGSRSDTVRVFDGIWVFEINNELTYQKPIRSLRKVLAVGKNWAVAKS